MSSIHFFYKKKVLQATLDFDHHKWSESKAVDLKG
jgi:hypothetical protein